MIYYFSFLHLFPHRPFSSLSTCFELNLNKMSLVFNTYRNKALPKEDSKNVWKNPENKKALLFGVIRHGKSWKTMAADVLFSHLGDAEALRLKYHAFENGKDSLDEHLLPLLG